MVIETLVNIMAFIIHLLMDIWADSLAIMNLAALYMDVQVCMWYLL